MVYILTVYFRLFDFSFFLRSEHLAFLTLELLCEVLYGQNSVPVHYVPKIIIIVSSYGVKAQWFLERSQSVTGFMLNKAYSKVYLKLIIRCVCDMSL